MSELDRPEPSAETRHADPSMLAAIKATEITCCDCGRGFQCNRCPECAGKYRDERAEGYKQDAAALRAELASLHATLRETTAPNLNQWTCFHCGETFTTVGAARDHFGATDGADAGCLIDRVALEEGGKPERGRGLLMALRKAEDRIAELVREVDSVENDARLWHESEAERRRLQKGHNTSWFMFLDSLEGERLVLREALAARTRERDALDLKLQAASGFVRDVIEALGQVQPPLDAVVDLPAIALQVVGQIEEGKAFLQAAEATLTAERVETRQMVDRWNAANHEANATIQGLEATLRAAQVLPGKWRDDADRSKLLQGLKCADELEAALGSSPAAKEPQ